jgi:hypothetical protein
MFEGALDKMAASLGAPAGYHLVLRGAAAGDEQRIHLNPLIGGGLRIEFDGRITCDHCARVTRKSYGEGYCYPCFRSLARCDLCVVSPARCHYAQGTCREPVWGEGFCMQPHVVYLANASGAKVGITRRDHTLTRWLDQGAVQGMVVATAATRHLAGLLEETLARRVSDRTDWRAMVRSEPPTVDLVQLRQTLRAAVPELPAGVDWVDAPVQDLAFPVLRYPGQPVRLKLAPQQPVAGRLIGIKGQYLLFEHGVFNVRQHRSHHVRVTPFGLADSAPGEFRVDGAEQRDLFDAT